MVGHPLCSALQRFFHHTCTIIYAHRHDVLLYALNAVPTLQGQIWTDGSGGTIRVYRIYLICKSYPESSPDATHLHVRLILYVWYNIYLNDVYIRYGLRLFFFSLVRDAAAGYDSVLRTEKRETKTFFK